MIGGIRPDDLLPILAFILVLLIIVVSLPLPRVFTIGPRRWQVMTLPYILVPSNEFSYEIVVALRTSCPTAFYARL
jgi:hypothetical protein